MQRSRRAWKPEGSLRDKQYELYTTRGPGSTSLSWVTLVITRSSKAAAFGKRDKLSSIHVIQTMESYCIVILFVSA